MLGGTRCVGGLGCDVRSFPSFQLGSVQPPRGVWSLAALGWHEGRRCADRDACSGATPTLPGAGAGGLPDRGRLGARDASRRAAWGGEPGGLPTAPTAAERE